MARTEWGHAGSMQAERFRLADQETVHLGPGDDQYEGEDVRGPGDMVYGQGGDDLISGRRGADVLHGGGGDDQLDGGKGRDRLYGGNGDDVLVGTGHDTLMGGLGADVIYTDASFIGDQVVYRKIEDSLPGTAHDTVNFFYTRTDRLDLHRIDANALTEADDRFTWVGDRAFSGRAGELRFDPGSHLLQADVTGDGVADFEILFASGNDPQQSDIVL